MTEYAILTVPINNTTNNNDKVLYTSQDAKDICEKIKEYNCTDAEHSIEIYQVDSDGDYIEGSDFDTITNFLKRNN